MKNIIFIAPPAAGKGTQSDLLVKKYGFIHISTGDLIRAEIARGSEIGKMVKEISESGGLVSDDIVTELLKNRLSEPDIQKGFILDGYPRTIEQANNLSNIAKELGLTDFTAIYLDLDLETSMHRALGRVTCPQCGRGYNRYEDVLKPISEGLCDDCGVNLTSRSDDNEETFKVRFNTYVENTDPLLNYYNELGILNKIDNSGTPEETFAKIEGVL